MYIKLFIFNFILFSFLSNKNLILFIYICFCVLLFVVFGFNLFSETTFFLGRVIFDSEFIIALNFCIIFWLLLNTDIFGLHMDLAYSLRSVFDSFVREFCLILVTIMSLGSLILNFSNFSFFFQNLFLNICNLIDLKVVEIKNSFSVFISLFFNDFCLTFLQNELLNWRSLLYFFLEKNIFLKKNVLNLEHFKFYC